MNPNITIWTPILLSALTFGNITVIQSPPSIITSEGETVDLHCTYNGPNGISAYKWYRNIQGGTEVSNKTSQYRGRVFSAGAEAFKARKDASLKIRDTKLYDSGTYYCKVEYVTYGEKYGPGTNLTVATSLDQAYGTKILWYIRAGIIVALILIGIVLSQRNCPIRVHYRFVPLLKSRKLEQIYEEIYEEIDFIGGRSQRLRTGTAEVAVINIENKSRQTFAPDVNEGSSKQF